MGIFTSGFISFLFILTLAWMFSMHLKERPFLELCVVLYVFLRGWTDWQHCSVCLHHTSFLSTFSTHYWGKSAEISVTSMYLFLLNSMKLYCTFFEVLLLDVHIYYYICLMNWSYCYCEMFHLYLWHYCLCCSLILLLL